MSNPITLEQVTFLHDDDNFLAALNRHIEGLRKQADQFEENMHERFSEYKDITVRDAKARGYIVTDSEGSLLN